MNQTVHSYLFANVKAHSNGYIQYVLKSGVMYHSATNVNSVKNPFVYQVVHIYHLWHSLG